MRVYYLRVGEVHYRLGAGRLMTADGAASYEGDDGRPAGRCSFSIYIIKLRIGRLGIIRLLVLRMFFSFLNSI